MTSISTIKQQAAASRQLLRTQLNSRSGGGINVDLEPLTITAALPNDEGIEENLLPVEALTRPLEVVIATIWPGSGNPVDVGAKERIEFYLNNATVPFHFEELTIPFPAGTFPYKANLPYQNFQSPGVHELYYKVTNSSDITETSVRTTFTVDTQAPPSGNHPQALQVPVTIIDKAYLDQNGGVECTVRDYSDKRPGDRVYGYVRANGEDPEGPFDAEDIFPVGGTGQLKLIFPAAAFERYPDGNVHLRFYLVDRAGNEGLFSLDTTVELLLTAPPANLEAPVVPLAIAPDNLIDREDVQFPGGVTVQVKEYSPRSNGRDLVYVYWASHVVDVFPVTAATTFPLIARVDFSVLANPDFGPRQDDVTYRITRGSRDYPSPARTIDVDLSLPGPENPDPGPENPNLVVPDLFGGGTSPELNKIRVEDKGLAADVVVKVPDNPADGDVIQLVYNGVPVPAPGGVVTLDGSERPGDDLDLSIAWSIIEGVGDAAAIPLFYTLTNPALINGQQSAAVPIEVKTFELGTINPPVFTDRTANGNVNCDHKIWEGVKVRILPDTVNFAQSDTITLAYTGYTGQYADPSSWVPIANTTGQVVHTLQQGEPASGVNLVIPFEPHIHTIGDNISGFVVATVRLDKPDGSNATSLGDYARIGITRPGGCVCVTADACPPSL